jgi:CRISPR/Cas system CSM-associated protein Csm3 (group 7 of RAMP superfamily)
MVKLKYKVKFLDYWHLSSGLSAGAKLDSTVVKDNDGLPYLSGKTLKGLVREMAEIIKLEEEKKNFIKKCFGDEGIEMGECYFSNAKLPKGIADEILENNLEDKLYDVIASTKIGKEDKFKDGKQIEKKDIAVDNSLREIEVVVPITLEGCIDNVLSVYKDEMIQALKMIKRMGLNRNRGLGRCEITITEVL